MRYTVRVQRSEFRDALKAAVATSDTIAKEAPTDCVMLAVEPGGYLAISSTNIQAVSRIAIDAEAEGGGTALLVARELLRVVDAFPAGELTIEVEPSDEGVVARVRPSESKRDCYTCKGFLPKLFPKLPELPKKWHKGDAGEMRRLLRACRPASCADETRLHLQSVRLEAEQGGLVAVATDGHRIHVARSRSSWPLTAATLPTKGVDALLRLIGDGSKELEMALHGSWFHARSGLTVVSIAVNTDPYPPWRNVIPEPSPSVEADTSAFISAVERVSVLSTNARCGATFTMGVEGLLVGIGDNEGREMVAEVPVGGEHFGWEVRMNASYVLDALEAVGADTCFLQVNGATSPVVISAPDGSATLVVMPMQMAGARP